MRITQEQLEQIGRTAFVRRLWDFLDKNLQRGFKSFLPSKANAIATWIRIDWSPYSNEHDVAVFLTSHWFAKVDLSTSELLQRLDKTNLDPSDRVRQLKARLFESGLISFGFFDD